MGVKIITYDRKAGLSDEVRDHLANAPIRREYEGGLGDVLYQLHATHAYSRIIAEDPGPDAGIVMACHNPHAKELFQWIPARGNVIVADTGFEDIKKESFRRAVNLPFERPASPHRNPDPVPFFHGPDDLGVLTELENFKPYIVFAPCGSSSSKMIPRDHVLSMHAEARAKGYNTVMIGRTYRLFYGGELSAPHHEMNLGPLPGHLDVVDRLSVPGVAHALARAAGVVAPNTATLILATCMNKPMLFSGDAHDYQTFIPNAPKGYIFRLHQPENVHYPRAEYTPEIMRKFLGGLP